MNIFILDNDPKKAARYHSDKHVVKMILETAQLLSTAHYELDGPHEKLYKPTHKNHPCAIWTRETKANYVWAYKLLEALLVEYTARFSGKTHKTASLMPYLKYPPLRIPNHNYLTPFALAMPPEYKSTDAVYSYRRYYAIEKKHLHSWKYFTQPEWLKELTTWQLMTV